MLCCFDIISTTCAVLPERCASASPQSALSFKSVNICYRNWIDCGVLRCLWVSMSCWRRQRSCWSESVLCCRQRHIRMPRCRWRMRPTLCVIPSSPATPRDSFCLCRQTSPARGTANAVSAADWRLRHRSCGGPEVRTATKFGCWGSSMARTPRKFYCKKFSINQHHAGVAL